MRARLPSSMLAVIICGILGCAVAHAQRQVSIQVPATSPPPTTTVSIQVDNALNIAGFQFEITYDPAKVRAVNAAEGTLTSGWLVAPNTTTPGRVIVIGLDLSLQGLPAGSGSLCTVQFDVLVNTNTTAALTFDTVKSKLQNAQAQDIAAAFTNGTLTLVPAASLVSVSGTVSYGGAVAGTLRVGLFTSGNLSSPLYGTVIASPVFPQAYTINNVATSATKSYYAAAFLDDGDGTLEPFTEPAGQYANNPFLVTAAVNGINMTLVDPPAALQRNVSMPDDATGGANSVCQVPINIDNGYGIAKFQFYVKFDEDVIKDTGVLRGSLLPADWAVYSTFVSNNPGTNETIIKITGAGITPLPGGAGSLVLLKFKVKNVAVGSTSNLQFVETADSAKTFLSDANDTPIPGLYDDGLFTVIAAITFNLVTTPGTDINAIALAMADTGLTTAEQLAQAIPNCTIVYRWRADTQSFEGHVKTSPLFNFALQVGSPYFVNVTAPVDFTLVGSVPAPFQFNLITTAGTDINAISLPFDQGAITTAEQLAQAIPNCSIVYRWRADTQSFEGHVKTSPLFNFAVQPGYPYLVNVTANGVWP